MCVRKFIWQWLNGVGWPGMERRRERAQRTALFVYYVRYVVVVDYLYIEMDGTDCEQISCQLNE